MPAGTEVRSGAEALAQLGTVADVCVNGVVGFAGLRLTLATLAAGKRLALANKESLIAGGPVVRAVLDQPGAGHIVPVDSEHCAVHQCLVANASGKPRRFCHATRCGKRSRAALRLPMKLSSTK